MANAESGETIEARNPARVSCSATSRGVGRGTSREPSRRPPQPPTWRATPPIERAARLLELADAVIARKEELAALDCADNGSPLADLRVDVSIGAGELRYFAGLALQTKGETIPGEFGRVNYTLREPFGVVGRLIPFNHPLLFATMKIGAPLVAGNTLVLKPSEHTSLSALKLAEDFERIFRRASSMS